MFEKLFQVAEIGNFSPKERRAYETSLKYYRDIKNVVDTSRMEGRQEVLQEIVRNMLAAGFSLRDIVKIFGYTAEQIAEVSKTR